MHMRHRRDSHPAGSIHAFTDRTEVSLRTQKTAAGVVGKAYACR